MYLFFPPRGAGNTSTSAFPFQIITEVAQSGIASNSFTSKCPCDTGDATYTSRYFFQTDSEYPIGLNSGAAAFKIYSGSALYSQIKMPDLNDPKNSYQGSANQYVQDNNDCSSIYQQSTMTVFGLNKSIFIRDFFGANPDPNDTLKIWLTVCFPAGEPLTDSEQAFGNTDTAAFTCHDCSQRANVPMAAFISCATGAWPELIESALINKGDDLRPRLEKRQVLARVPIGEINASGQIIAQYLNNNLTLVDCCLGGIPAKYPMSIFNEFR
jgi:hypothetical protein